MIEKLRHSIRFNLPGEESHLALSPIDRPLSSLALKNATVFKESAVAVVLYKENNDLKIILTQRQVYKGVHSGQVSFPGGKKESYEIDLFDTATRECYEEIGLTLDTSLYCGKLTPVYIPVSQFYVDSHVFFLEKEPNLKKDKREVNSIFTIKASELLDDSNLKKKDILISPKNVLKEVPHFYIENKVIWGATALILNELKIVLTTLDKF